MATGVASPMAPPKVPLAVNPGAPVNTLAPDSMIMVSAPRSPAIIDGEDFRSEA